MSDQRPLVLAPDPNDATSPPIIQRLRVSDEIDDPTRDRVDLLEDAFRSLVMALAEQEIELPDNVLQFIEDDQESDQESPQ